MTDSVNKPNDKRELSIQDIIASAAIEIEEQALPDDFRREFQSRDDRSLGERFLLLISSPHELFKALTPSSGWLWPIVFIACASLTNAFVTLNFSDLESYFDRQKSRNTAKLSKYQQKRLANLDESQKRISEKSGYFIVKAQAFVLPIVSSIFWLFWFSTVLFFLAMFGRGHRNYALCMTIVAHASMIRVIEYFASAVVISATELVVIRSDLTGVMQVQASPFLYATLTWLNPFSLLFYYYLYCGLVASARVEKLRGQVGILFTMLLSFGFTIALTFAIAKYAPGAKG